MTATYKTATRCIAATALFLVLGSAHAALIAYEINGDVVFGNDNGGPNVFGLNSGDTITATGIFDDSGLSGAGNGTLSFASGSGNTMSISVGTETFTAANDTRFGTGGGPTIALSSFTTLDDFDFLALVGTNGASADFSSFFTSFDNLGTFFGDWQTTISTQVVPVPAAVWLFSSGLIGLVGIARRKRV